MPRLSALALGVTVSVLAIALPQASGGQAIPASAPAAVPGRLVVKYRPSVNACPHCLLAQRRAFTSTTGSDSLDRLHAELGVRAATPLLAGAHGSAAERRAAAAERLTAAVQRAPGRARRAAPSPALPDLSNVFLLELPSATDVVAAARRYAADPNVEYAEPDWVVSTLLVPDDPYFSSQGTWGESYADLWGLHILDAASAWDVANGTGALVAVIDTGVDFTHPDLAANIWSNPGETAGNGIDDDGNGFVDDVRGWDFDTNDNDPSDGHGHGTHVAGTVAAAGNNGLGVVGLAWGARVMAVKGLSDKGAGSSFGLAQALIYAAENGADVLNNSWGASALSWTISEAVETVLGMGVIVVAAAGNSSMNGDWWTLMGIPGVIPVGATNPDDTIAYFSNYGEKMSVAAPGVDVLSLRAAGTTLRDTVVGNNYLRLSGTSMASPHVAGLAAVLLSALPALTADEVRWHLELNADQPGYPGYEGEPWNPYFGWGRINAARVFDPPPVITRFQPHSIVLHGYVDSTLANAASVELSFTSIQPLTWTASASSWLQPSLAAGAGKATISLDLDTTGLPITSHNGSLSITAPDASDGGASVPVTLHLHRDERIGGEIGIATDLVSRSGFPAVASDGLGTLAVWGGSESSSAEALNGAFIDSAGNVIRTEIVPMAALHGWMDVASDGRNYLVAWVEERTWPQMEIVLYGVLVGPTGATAGEPFVIDSIPADGLPSTHYLHSVNLAFDGRQYIAVWGDYDAERAKGDTYVRSVGTDGSIGFKRRKVRAARSRVPGDFVRAAIACRTGQCLVAWNQFDPASTPYPLRMFAARTDGDRVLDARALTVFDGPYVYSYAVQVASDGAGYLVVGGNLNACGEMWCGSDAIAARVTADGQTPDRSNAIRLSNAPLPAGSPYVMAGGLTFDGTNYVATLLYGPQRVLLGDPQTPYQRILAARIAPDGTVLDDERDGLLLLPDEAAASAAIAATATHDVVVYGRDPGNLVDPYLPATYSYNAVKTQRCLPHSSVPPVPDRPIGTIGAQVVAERAALHFTVSAPGLVPATTTYSAANLPPGAVFDAASRTFRWMPAGDEAGTYSDVRIDAADGITAVSEQFAITVTEATRAITGVVKDASGSPAADVVIRIDGTAGGPRLGRTDSSGRFRFHGLAPREYRLRLGKPSSRFFKLEPRSVAVDVTAGDALGLELALTYK